MENFKLVALQADTCLTLGEMRRYLNEWFASRLTEEVISVNYQDYTKALVMKDDKNNNIFYAPFSSFEKINDNTKVSLSGIVNQELKGLVGKCIDLDKQLSANEVTSEKSYF